MLYTFRRSQAAFRVRIASNLKGSTPPSSTSNSGDQFKPEQRAQNHARGRADLA
jgi:hypothetical protein